jgi:hypothetical protein
VRLKCRLFSLIVTVLGYVNNAAADDDDDDDGSACQLLSSWGEKRLCGEAAAAAEVPALMVLGGQHHAYTYEGKAVRLYQ